MGKSKMQDQDLEVTGLLPPLRQKERGEGVLSRTQQGSPVEKAALRAAMAFPGGTARLLRPSRQGASRENTPTPPSTLPCPTGAAHWQSTPEGREKPWHSALPLLGQRDPKGRRDSFQHREMSHLCFPVGCSQVLLTAIVHWRPRRPWKSAWVWSQPELSLNPGPATCRLDTLLTLLRIMRAGTLMLAV